MDGYTIQEFEVKCKVCGTLAQEIETRDNGACGDPECCGDFVEWAVLVCPKCNMTEELDLR